MSIIFANGLNLFSIFSFEPFSVLSSFFCTADEFLEMEFIGRRWAEKRNLFSLETF